MDWTILLFVSKWVWIALVYFILILLLLTMQRELGLRITTRRPQAPVLAHLRLVDPGTHSKMRSGTELDLSADTSLGAETDNQIVLKDPYISAHHARFHWDGTSWWVEDLGSRNGTLVNGTSCIPHQPQALPAGTRVQMGGMIFQLVE